MRISVVVPVYNVKQYLQRCVDSVLSQGDPDYEIILVDDGSTDGGGSLCDVLAAVHPQISAIHRENGGLSAARNTGIRAASGGHVLFLDSDDELMPGCLAVIRGLLEAHAPQVLIGQFTAVAQESGAVCFARDTLLIPERINGRPGESVAAEMMRVQASPCAWRYVVRLDFLRRNGLYFKEGLLCEDMDWTPRLLCAATDFWLNEQVFYRYYIRENSIMTTFSFKRALDIFSIVTGNYAFAGGLSDAQRLYVNNLSFLALGNMLQEYARFGKAERKAARQWFRENRRLLLDLVRPYPAFYFLSLSLGPLAAMRFIAFGIKARQRLRRGARRGA